jgi:hypothetical protein
VTRPEAFYLDLFKRAGLNHFNLLRLDICHNLLDLEPEALYLFKKDSKGD